MAAKRHTSAVKRGLPDRHGATGGIQYHSLGALGELAVAQALGAPWRPGIDTFQTPGGDGIGMFEVRCRSRHTYDLIIRRSDPDNRTYILVTSENLTEFRVHGWTVAGHAKRHPEWVQGHGGREPAWFVPQADLFDLKYLKTPA